MLAPDPAMPPDSDPVTTGAVQVYVVPAGTIPLVLLTGEAVNVPPLQIAVIILVTAGIGLTVTVTVNVGPVHVPESGVTVYIAVCGMLVELTSVPLMFTAPLPAAPPVNPPDTEGADHEYVVPAGTVPSVPSSGVVVNVPPLQITAARLEIVAFGLTVMVTLNGVPVQLPDTGVTL